MRLEIERQALKKEKDDISKERLAKIDEQLASLKEEEKDYRLKWEKEKEIKALMNKKKEELEQARFDLKQAESNYDLESAARLAHGVIPDLEKELKELTDNNSADILSDEVTEEDIAKVISKWTNIPISKLIGGEKEKLLNLKENMKQRSR